MKTVEVKNQVHLPLRRCVELVLNGIRFRLFRAAITVAIISLAVAFLTTMLTESVVTKNVAEAIKAQTAPRRLLLYWVSRLAVPIKDDDLLLQLAQGDGGKNFSDECKIWGKLSDADFDRLADTAQLYREYTDYFNNSLTESNLVTLFDRDRGNAIFHRLQSPQARASFFDKLEQLGKRLPTETSALETFLKEWQGTLELRERVLAGHRQALAGVEKQFNDRQPTKILAGADNNFLQAIGELGYRMDPDELESIKVQAQLSLDAEQLVRTLSLSFVKQRLARRERTKVNDVTSQLLFSAVKSTSGAKWLIEQMEDQKNKLTEALARRDRNETLKNETQKKLESSLISSRAIIEQFDFEPKRITRVAIDRLEQNKLTEVEASVGNVVTTGGFMGFPPRTMWLIIVSFLVCIVGITNAMLMSVTDRFQEIATMKCLGATDGFIMLNFVLESCMQGTFGGITGAILGLLLGVLRSWASFGWIAMTNFPLPTVVMLASMSLVAGVVISALAAVYPAWVAARLAPMEAMRIE